MEQLKLLEISYTIQKPSTYIERNKWSCIELIMELTNEDQWSIFLKKLTDDIA